MKIVTGISALAALLGVALLWTSGGLNGFLSVGLVAGAGLVAITVAGAALKWFRNRRRRQIMDMRDSALW